MIRPILVTGAAGFIGAAVVQRLLADGEHVIGLDSLNGYYDPNLKRARLAQLNAQNGRWDFELLDIADGPSVANLFTTKQPRAVVHLAAQAGVRYSLENPNAYVQSNLVGFGHILEGCRSQAIEHFVYASSSSVYGGQW